MTKLNFENIKLIISEVDGVITDGTSLIGEANITIGKYFCLKDFEAINKIKKQYNFVFLSSDASIRKNIPFFFAEKDKETVYMSIVDKYRVTSDNVLYVGSNYSDLGCIRRSGFSACPEDAVIQVKNTTNTVLPVYGGAGVLFDELEVALTRVASDQSTNLMEHLQRTSYQIVVFCRAKSTINENS